MKTIPFILALIVSWFISIESNAQRFYLQAGAGYGFTFLPGGPGDYEYQSDGTVRTEKIKNDLSLGKGFQFSGIFGREWNQYFATELAFSYLMGHQFSGSSKFVNQNYSIQSDESMEGRMFRIIPTIKIFGGTEKIRPYAKAGFIIGLMPMVQRKANSESTGFEPQKSTRTWETTGGSALGFFGSAGVDFSLGPNIQLFSEIAFCGQTYKPEKTIMKSYTENGVDKLSSLKTRDKETVYVYETKNIFSEPTDYEKPRKQFQIYLPFSSIGINVGVKFYFGGNGESPKSDL